jgi:hypothetical protein
MLCYPHDPAPHLILPSNSANRLRSVLLCIKMPSNVDGSTARSFPTIKHVRTFITQGPGSGGDYHNVRGGHWLIDSKISTPMSQYEKYRKSRTSWGINVLGSFCVEIEATDGTKGFATGFGGPPACWLVAEHFERFLLGQGEFGPRNTKQS